MKNITMCLMDRLHSKEKEHGITTGRQVCWFWLVLKRPRRGEREGRQGEHKYLGSMENIKTCLMDRLYSKEKEQHGTTTGRQVYWFCFVLKRPRRGGREGGQGGTQNLVGANFGRLPSGIPPFSPRFVSFPPTVLVNYIVTQRIHLYENSPG